MFCAWCFWTPSKDDPSAIEDMNQSVHRHVATCPEKPPSAGADPLFVSEPIIQKHWRDLKERRVREELINRQLLYLPAGLVGVLGALL